MLYVTCMPVQCNPYIADTVGTGFIVRYSEVSCNLIFGTLVSGRYSIDGLYSGVAAKWGSTVYNLTAILEPRQQVFYKITVQQYNK